MTNNAVKTLAQAVMLCCLLPSVSHGSTYTSYGAGTRSCKQYLVDRRNGAHIPSMIWVQGWVSAVGHYGIADLRHIDANAMVSFVDRYCRETPLEDVDGAARALVKALMKKKRNN